MRTPLSLFCLLAPLAAQQAPTIQIHATGTLAEQLVIDPQAKPEPAALDNITRFAARFAQPALREGEEFRSIGKNTIVALARPAQHDWLRQFIRLNQSVKNYAVRIECRFVTAEPAAWRRAVAPLLGKQPEKRSHAILAPGPKTARYLKRLGEQRGVSYLASQSVTALPAQRAHVSILNQTTYWKDYHPEFDARGKLVRVARVSDVVQDGIVLDSRAALIRPGRIGLQITATLSNLKKPIRSCELRFKGLADKLVLQVPEVEAYEIKTEIDLRDGATAVFPMPKRDGQRLAVLLTARRILVN